MNENASLQKYVPELDPIYQRPVWFHNHGDKTRDMDFDRGAKKIIIANVGVASINISPLEGEWFVAYEITHSTGKTSGFRNMTTKELRSAFGLSDENSKHGSLHLLKRFGGTCAEQGKFIRWENCLNIPCPGTGLDGDPNISIELNDNIIATVKELISL
ncbi:MAG: hypothetical protein ABIH48_03065 [Candidatus Falkowbacteria bacterium]